MVAQIERIVFLDGTNTSSATPKISIIKTIINITRLIALSKAHKEHFKDALHK